MILIFRRMRTHRGSFWIAQKNQPEPKDLHLFIDVLDSLHQVPQLGDADDRGRVDDDKRIPLLAVEQDVAEDFFVFVIKNNPELVEG